MYFIDKETKPQRYPHINCRSFLVKSGESKKNATLFHNHNHIILEIIAIKQGAMHLVTEEGDYILKSGDVAIINPLCLHFGETHEDLCEYICVTINIKPWFSFLDSKLRKTVDQILEEKYYFKELYKGSNPIFPLLLSVETLFEKDELSAECELSKNIYSIFAILFENISNVKENTTNTRNAEFMKSATVYIQNHYKENISTSDISKEFYMTVPCFCYTFKHNFGTSFIRYLSNYRINKAIELASKKHYLLSELAAEVGFLDYNYFSRTFKKVIGTSPSEYFGRQK